MGQINDIYYPLSEVIKNIYSIYVLKDLAQYTTFNVLIFANLDFANPIDCN